MKLIYTIFFVAAFNLVFIVISNGREAVLAALKNKRQTATREVFHSGDDAVIMPGLSYLLPR